MSRRFMSVINLKILDFINGSSRHSKSVDTSWKSSNLSQNALHDTLGQDIQVRIFGGFSVLNGFLRYMRLYQ